MIKYLVYICFFYITYFFINRLIFVKKYLIDSDFKKPQSFHRDPIPRSGGLIILILIIIFWMMNFNLKYIYFLYFLILNFIIGFLADTSYVNAPIKRFLIIIAANIILIVIYDINIKNFNLSILDYLNTHEIFKYILVLLAIFFIVNGSNLIDGFNGLLSINILIITFFHYLLTIDLELPNFLQLYSFYIFTITILFLTINFPNAKVFLGDGGAYLLGSHVGIFSIILANQSEKISSFFIANLLFYIFFEIFFSVFRKLFQKKNPFLPDKHHLHMLLYKKLKKNFYYANPLTSIIINLCFISLVIPSYFFFDNNFVCKTIFVSQLIFYLTSYLFLSKKN